MRLGGGAPSRVPPPTRLPALGLLQGSLAPPGGWTAPGELHLMRPRSMLSTLTPIALAWVVIAVSFGVIANRAVDAEKENEQGK